MFPAIEVPFEGIHPVFPELAKRIQPSIQLPERFGSQSVQTVLGLDCGLDEPSFPQDPKVFGYRGLGELQFLAQLTYRAFRFRQKMQNVPPMGFGDDVEDGIHIENIHNKVYASQGIFQISFETSKSLKSSGKITPMAFQTYCMVRPEHLNHHGFLFGGQLLLWVDEYAWLAAAKENPGCRLVTRAMDKVEFTARAKVGAILRFDVVQTHRGRTSMNYRVDVWADEPGATTELKIFTTTVTFVNVDAEGHKVDLCACGDGHCED